VQTSGGTVKSLNAFFGGAEEVIADQVQAALGTALTEYDCWIIEDLWDDTQTGVAPHPRSLWKRIREWQRSRK
jgi:hypothetical protein